NRGQPGHVLLADRPDQIRRLDAREYREREPGANPVDRDQPLEEILLDLRRETVEREHVLAYVGVHTQRDGGSRLSEHVERRERPLDVVAHALHVDDRASGGLFHKSATQERDHYSTALSAFITARGAPLLSPARGAPPPLALPRAFALGSSRRR